MRRESIAAEYVYVAAARATAAKQIEQRRALVAPGLAAAIAVAPTLEVEVLVEVIHGVRLPPPDAATVAARRLARGVRASEADVSTVLARHGPNQTES